jgi:L-serine dehydratase
VSISLFDLFSIGIGPSSSHTVGPMRAAAAFAHDALADLAVGPRLADVRVDLYGSLAATGRGHGTLDAIVMGLEGNAPETVDPVAGRERVGRIDREGGLLLDGRVPVDVRTSTITLHPHEVLPQHPNGMRFTARDEGGAVLTSREVFSVGGGFVVDAQEMDQPVGEVTGTEDSHAVFDSGAQLLAVCEDRGIAVSDVMMLRERQWRGEREIRAGALGIWQVMSECIEAGMHTPGVLPGGLEVPRRAASWYGSLSSEDPDHSPLSAMEWVSLAALAVNEENAAGGRVVTAPTNGAAGIIPAVLYYAVHYCTGEARSPQPGSEAEDVVVRFLLTAAAVGSLCKEHASISGAEVGCQGEVGSACSMAAAGLTEIMGGKPTQVENAAEIAMEHNLGLTCDPVGGLVQVPCIERNAMAAIKAITAARFALRGTGKHFVSLDTVIETMRQTGKDMSSRYKETAMGGLATTVPVSVPEC